MNRLFPLLGLSALLVWSPLFFSGCTSSTPERTYGHLRSAQICQLDHGRVRDKAVTDLGEIYIYEIVRPCKRTGNWVMRAFHDDDHRGKMKLGYLRNRPTSVTVDFQAPYWLRFTAMDGNRKRVWDFIAHRGDDGRWRGKSCVYNDERRNISVDDDFDLLSCLGPNDYRGSWRPSSWAWVTEQRLKDPEVFDDELFSMIDERRQDAEFLSWIALFVADTWEDRTTEGRERAATAVEQIDCETLLQSEDQYWEHFVTSGRTARGDEFARQVSKCDRWLIQNLSADFDKIVPRLDDPAMAKRIDDAVESAGDDIEDELLALWTIRLEREPNPSPALLDQVDRLLIEERRFEVLLERLDTGVEMTESLLAQLREDFTHCCAHHNEAQQVLDHPMVEKPEIEE